jgi:hypothetical protein
VLQHVQIAPQWQLAHVIASLYSLECTADIPFSGPNLITSIVLRAISNETVLANAATLSNAKVSNIEKSQTGRT